MFSEEQGELCKVSTTRQVLERAGGQMERGFNRQQQQSENHRWQRNLPRWLLLQPCLANKFSVNPAVIKILHGDNSTFPWNILLKLANEIICYDCSFEQCKSSTTVLNKPVIYSAWNTYFYKYLCRGTLEVGRINYKQENGILKCALTLFAPTLSPHCSTLT